MIEIVPATMAHARAIELRPQDAAEIAAHGVSKEHGLRISLDHAMWANAYLVTDDKGRGEVAAILGCGMSCMVGGHATPWLITGRPIDRVAKSFAKLARARIAELRAIHPLMVNFVHADYARSLKFMAWLGFTIDPPQPMGPLGAPFCRIHMGDHDGN